MSPVPTAIREQDRGRPVPNQPFLTADVLHGLGKEIVVDWQLSDQDRKG